MLSQLVSLGLHFPFLSLLCQHSGPKISSELIFFFFTRANNCMYMFSVERNENLKPGRFIF